MNFKIRSIISDDIPALKSVIDSNELFPSEMLDEMMEGYFNDDQCEEIWLTCDDGQPNAIAYCAPERMTAGTWNLYLIAVNPSQQGQGIGTALVQHIERVLTDRSQRVLLIETSSLESYAKTWEFYEKNGYTQEARIREFYDAGEDKIVFRKSLNRLENNNKPVVCDWL